MYQIYIINQQMGKDTQVSDQIEPWVS